MTFAEWIQDLTDPSHLLTEGIYNITFEILATWIFVKISLNKILKKRIQEELNKDKKEKCSAKK